MDFQYYKLRLTSEKLDVKKKERNRQLEACRCKGKGNISSRKCANTEARMYEKLNV
jgi:hypothetical protein